MGETISEAIAADHASFDEFADYLRTATDDAEKVRWRNQLTWTVARHALSEELTLYPAMEKHLGDEGVRLAKTDKEQHQGVCIIFIFKIPVVHALTTMSGQGHFV
jgi:hemerythrin superfamily protein